MVPLSYVVLQLPPLISQLRYLFLVGLLFRGNKFAHKSRVGWVRLLQRVDHRFVHRSLRRQPSLSLI